MDSDLIEVRVAVSQPGARLGQTRLVNPKNPAIQTRLALGYLVRLSPEVETPAADEVEPPADPPREEIDRHEDEVG